MTMKITARRTVTVLVASAALLVLPAVVSGVASAEATPPSPVMLAETGFDITWPVILGIAALLLGIAFVGWAFLRNPDRKAPVADETDGDRTNLHH